MLTPRVIHCTVQNVTFNGDHAILELREDHPPSGLPPEMCESRVYCHINSDIAKLGIGDTVEWNGRGYEQQQP